MSSGRRLDDILIEGTSYTWKQLYDAKDVKNMNDPGVEAAIKKLLPLIKSGVAGGSESFSGRQSNWFKPNRHNGSPTWDKKLVVQSPGTPIGSDVRLEELLCMALFNAKTVLVKNKPLTIVDYQVPTFNSKENIDLVGFILEDGVCHLQLIEAKAPGSGESSLRALMEITAHVDKLLVSGYINHFINEAKSVFGITTDSIVIHPAILLFEDNIYTQIPNSRGACGQCASRQARDIEAAIQQKVVNPQTQLIEALHERLRQDASNDSKHTPFKIAPFSILLETAAQVKCVVKDSVTGNLRRESFRRMKSDVPSLLLNGLGLLPRKPTLAWTPEVELLVLA